jgi:hypothetical protein
MLAQPQEFAQNQGYTKLDYIHLTDMDIQQPSPITINI